MACYDNIIPVCLLRWSITVFSSERMLKIIFFDFTYYFPAVSGRNKHAGVGGTSRGCSMSKITGSISLTVVSLSSTKISWAFPTRHCGFLFKTRLAENVQSACGEICIRSNDTTCSELFYLVHWQCSLDRENFIRSLHIFSTLFVL